MRSSFATLLMVAGVACGGKQASVDVNVGGPAGRSDVRGTLLGQPFAGSDSLSYSGSDPTGDSFLTVWVSSFPHACGLATQNAGVRDGLVLVLNLGTLDETTGKLSAATQPGEYKLGEAVQGRFAQAAALRTDGTCRAAPLAVGAPSGMVTLATIGPTGVSGTFDLTFAGTGDHVTGGFEAVACPAALLSARTPATSCR